VIVNGIKKTLKREDFDESVSDSVQVGTVHSVC